MVALGSLTRVLFYWIDITVAACYVLTRQEINFCHGGGCISPTAFTATSHIIFLSDG